MANKFEQMPYLYGKLNQEVKTNKYTGLKTDDIVVTVDNDKLTIAAMAVPATIQQLNAVL